LDGDGVSQLSIFGGRGILSESAGPVWMVGTASEHFVLYQYSFIGASNHYAGYLQTETPYYQPFPLAPSPFALRPDFHDPVSYDGGSAWAVNIDRSSDILIYGAGTYSFFSSINSNCTDEKNCQGQIVNVDESSHDINMYQLSTIGTTYQLSVDFTGVIDRSSNNNGFASTVTQWKSE
jgi:glucan 1,3-beta-glucosidase